MPRLVIAKWIRKPFPTTPVDKLIPQMPYEIPDKPIKVRGGRNLEYLRRLFPHQERLRTIAKSVNKLIDEERVEFNYFRGYEVRNYTERLIAEAIRYGDCHKPTMELANFYLNDKTLIHKLFKVLVPRYLNYTTSFTSMHLLPSMKIDWSNPEEKQTVTQKVIIELKENPYPPITEYKIDRKNLLHNILLSEASKDYYRQKTMSNVNETEVD